MLWDPMRFLESCPSSRRRVRRRARPTRPAAKRSSKPPAWIAATAVRSELGQFPGRDPVQPQAGVECAHDVYQQAGITNPREEIDVAELYVPFSWYEPMWLEGHDIAEPGQGLEDGRQRRDRDHRQLPGQPVAAACCRRTRSARPACCASSRRPTRCAARPASTRSTAPAPRSPRPTAAPPSTSPWASSATPSRSRVLTKQPPASWPGSSHRTLRAGERYVGSSLKGRFLSGRGSPGRPSTRSPTMLRCTWSVPPPMRLRPLVEELHLPRADLGASSSGTACRRRRRWPRRGRRAARGAPSTPSLATELSGPGGRPWLDAVWAAPAEVLEELTRM